jgi:UDP-glucose 4-epimerase
VPSILGFDPLFQFLHERDVARALTLALEKKLRGVYNVAGPQPVPLSVLVRETGRKPMPLPEVLFNALLGRFGLPRLPPGALTHIKYPVVMDAAAFRAATGFTYEVDEVQAMREFGKTFPLPVKAKKAKKA